MEPFKNKYNLQNLKTLSLILKHNEFNQNKFLKDVSKELQSLEMKSRVDLISKSIHDNFKLSYTDKIKFLITKLDEIKEIDIFMIWPFTNYVAKYGLEHLDQSAIAMIEMTKRFSSEFVVRFYIQKYESKMYSLYFERWVKDKNEHVRRLVSEGSRPNLPWGIKVNYINQNLNQNVELLNTLKDDDSLYVRKSVANHLNDISRIDPELMLNTLSNWNLNNANQKWIIKSACRTLLKQGDSRALALNGYSIDPDVKLLKKYISTETIKEGDTFEISFELINKSDKVLNLSIDYILFYPKKNGSLSPKIFKLKDVALDKKLFITKNVPFKKVTTRTHYKGVHNIEIKISNRVFKFKKFELM